MPTKWDEPTFQARLAHFQEQPSPALASALAGQGDERALPALVKASGDCMEGPDALAYREAVRSLATIGLLERWIAGDLEQRRVAAHALTARFEAHVLLIGRALRDEDAQVRAIARRSLRSWKDGPALRAVFVEQLQNGDARVRALAAEGLGKIVHREAAGPLRAALEQETDEGARHRMEWAIERVGG